MHYISITAMFVLSPNVSVLLSVQHWTMMILPVVMLVKEHLKMVSFCLQPLKYVEWVFLWFHWFLVNPFTLPSLNVTFGANFNLGSKVFFVFLFVSFLYFFFCCCFNFDKYHSNSVVVRTTRNMLFYLFFSFVSYFIEIHQSTYFSFSIIFFNWMIKN